MAAGVAFFGLSTWNRQLKGQTEYELAQRILRNTYRLRDRTGAVRRHIIFIANLKYFKNMQKESNSVEHANMAKHLRGSLSKVEEENNIREISTELEADFIESEVVFGDSLSIHYAKFLALTSEVDRTANDMRMFLAEMQSETLGDIKETLKPMLAAGTERLKEPSFHNKLEQAIKFAEKKNSMRRHLGSNRSTLRFSLPRSPKWKLRL